MRETPTDCETTIHARHNLAEHRLSQNPLRRDGFQDASEWVSRVALLVCVAVILGSAVLRWLSPALGMKVNRQGIRVRIVVRWPDQQRLTEIRGTCPKLTMRYHLLQFSPV